MDRAIRKTTLSKGEKSDFILRISKGSGMRRAVARAVIGGRGGVNIHILVLYPTICFVGHNTKL